MDISYFARKFSGTKPWRHVKVARSAQQSPSSPNTSVQFSSLLDSSWFWYAGSLCQLIQKVLGLQPSANTVKLSHPMLSVQRIKEPLQFATPHNHPFFQLGVLLVILTPSHTNSITSTFQYIKSTSSKLSGSLGEGKALKNRTLCIMFILQQLLFFKTRQSRLGQFAWRSGRSTTVSKIFNSR